MVVNHPEAQQLNETIRSMYDAIFARIETMQRNGTFDVELLKQTKETEVEKKADFPVSYTHLTLPTTIGV